MIDETIAWLLKNAFLVLFVLAGIFGFLRLVKRANAKRGKVWESVSVSVSESESESVSKGMTWALGR